MRLFSSCLLLLRLTVDPFTFADFTLEAEGMAYWHDGDLRFEDVWLEGLF